MEQYPVYDEATNVTLYIPANSLEDAVALSETDEWQKKFLSTRKDIVQRWVDYAFDTVETEVNMTSDEVMKELVDFYTVLELWADDEIKAVIQAMVFGVVEDLDAIEWQVDEFDGGDGVISYTDPTSGKSIEGVKLTFDEIRVHW